MHRWITAILIVAFAAACGGFPPPSVGIHQIENVQCTVSGGGGQDCVADVNMQIYLPDGIADKLTVVVSTPSMGNASLAASASGELLPSTWLTAQGTAPSCTPGLADVYVSSMLTLPTGEITVDGVETEANVTCN